MNVKEWLGEDNQLGADIWEKKYRYNNESFEEFLNRVSAGNSDIKELIREKKFLFGGRILSNRGTEGNKTYSNCYVLTPPEDNLESIFDTAKHLARTFSYGGGVGIDIGKLAPKGAKVNNTAKESSGAVSFMDLYNTTTALIGQNGRRGALMLSMPVSHPDIKDFIKVKSDLNKITNANISVRVDDEFMNAVKNDGDYNLKFERPETGENFSEVVKARELFRLLCEQNWNYAEPGMLFWDRVEKWTMMENTPSFAFSGTNPCAEEPLPSGGSCLLGAINLSAYVKISEEDPDELYPIFDIQAFGKDVEKCVVALNEVLEEGLPLHPLQEQRDAVDKWKQIGLGVMGYADALIKMGYTYGSKDSLALADIIGSNLFYHAFKKSVELGKLKGSFKEFNEEQILSANIVKEHRIFEVPALRNSQLLTIAPTGSISTMIGVSGGTEPIFANSYTRKTQSLHGEDVYYKVFTPIAKDYIKKHHLKDESELPEFFITAPEIDSTQRVKVQAVWQKHIDASISSTINLPNSASVEDVMRIYFNAWESGLKGVTIYRAGCAREGVLVVEPKKNENEVTESKEVKSEKKEIAKEPTLGKDIGLERHLTTGCGSLHVCAFFDSNGNLKNTYLSKGSSGGCNNYMIGLSRMMSLAARNGVGIEAIVDQLNSCGVCPSYAVRTATKHDTSIGSCCPVAVGNALLSMHKEIMQYKVTDNAEASKNKPIEKKVEQPKKPVVEIKTTAKCPKCGAPILHEGGCDICKSCGYTKCD